MKRKTGISRPSLPMYERIRQILDSARSTAARSVNTTQVVANWLIGREIVEEEQKGCAKAEYGARLLADLSGRLQEEYGNGYSVDNLEFFRRFYREYPVLISEAPRRISTTLSISDAPRRKSSSGGPGAATTAELTVGSKNWKPGMLHPNLSWTLSAPTKMGGAK
ncbi:MAG: hypothetical protein IMZ46_12100 [Acidobacteria bacterium]|nr:hypothetical protein [Acidobacteriota bacterium]